MKFCAVFTFSLLFSVSLMGQHKLWLQPTLELEPVRARQIQFAGTPGWMQDNHLSSAKTQKAPIAFEFKPAASYTPSIQLQEKEKIPFRQKAGVAFLASAIVPGLGQANNGNWVRAGAYFAAEVFGLVYHFDSLNKARRQERAYEAFVSSQWSVVAYSQWLLGYYDQHGLSHPQIDDLRQMVTGVTPRFNLQEDMKFVDIRTLNNIEKNTPFIFANGRVISNFSHVLPEFGTQQYFELVAKYFQFQAGWRDFYETNTLDPAHTFQYEWNGTDATPLFFEGTDRARQFNSNFRKSGNLITFVVINHVVSAFDAFFTARLANHSRFSADVNMLSTEQVSLRYHF